VIYEWDVRKATANLAKHGISFEDAASVFLDPLAMTFSDPDHCQEEEREITIGYSRRRQVVFVAHSRRENRQRLISARLATKKERKQYEEGHGKAHE
jgi:uncharacterized DUF497 family protein